MIGRVVSLGAIASAVAVVACNDMASHEPTASQSARVAFRDDSIPPSLGTPTVSSAFPIDAAPPTADQVGFRSAELDGTYLVGWQDQRNDGNTWGLSPGVILLVTSWMADQAHHSSMQAISSSDQPK